MNKQEIQALVKEQRTFFKTGATLNVRFRIENLKKLRATVKKYENEIAEALKADLGKSDYESYMCETGMALSEITYLIKHTKKLSREKRLRPQWHSFPHAAIKSLFLTETR